MTRMTGCVQFSKYIRYTHIRVIDCTLNRSGLVVYALILAGSVACSRACASDILHVCIYALY